MAENDKIATLSVNVAVLLEQCQKLREQNKQLTAKLQAEKALSLTLLDKTKAMEKQNTTLTLAKAALEISGTAKNAKARINAMIKDIDRAIAMISTNKS